MRKAYTLVEVLVVIAIIGVLIGLLLPAVQSVRAAAAKTACLNNCHQIGLAMQNYAGTQGFFPAAENYDPKKSPYQLSSWRVSLTPFLEQDAVYQMMVEDYANPSMINFAGHRGFQTTVPVFVCKADYRIQTSVTHAVLSGKLGLSSYAGVCGKNCIDPDGALYRDSRVTFGMITDGSSNTIVVGERPPSSRFDYGFWYGSASRCDAMIGAENLDDIGIGCGPGPFTFQPGNVNEYCAHLHFWSLHSGGGHFIFGDGRAEFLRYSAAKVLPALSTIAGGETEIAYE